MLNKLLKYDMKSIGKQLFVCYGAVIIFAIITRLLSLLSAKFSIFSFIAMPIQIVFYIIMVGSFFYTFFVSIKRFYLNIYKDEGYLTNTLPVTKSKILLSKTLSSTFYMILNFLIVILALWIGTDIIAFMSPMINEIYTQLNVVDISKTLVVTIFIILMLMSYLSTLLTFYVSIALGHATYKDKMANTVLAGVIVYIGTQFLSLILLIPFFLMNRNIFTNPNMIPTSSSIVVLLVSSFALIAICNIAYYYITNKMLNKKFNID